MVGIQRSPRTARAVSAATRVARRAATTVLLAAALAACGGGDLIDPFRPKRQLSFGDETSALTADGHNWGVNGLNAAGNFDCTVNRNWVQYLAAIYGFVFAQCNPNLVATPQATLRASPGATVADVVTQIAAQVQAGGIGTGDLVTVLAGQNDILEQYASYPGRDEATLTTELRSRGQRLAEQVNGLAERDSRVIVSTVPDLGLTPFAVTEAAAHTDTDRAALLSRLTAAFNARLRANLVNDGRKIGLVLADEMTQTMRRVPSLSGLTNTTQAVCAVAPPDCTTQTLVANGSSVTWLWSDATQLGATGQIRLGLLAEARARNNPF